MKLKLGKIVTMAVSTLVLASTIPVIAEANNSRQDVWSYSVGRIPGNAYVSNTGRDKTDNSSVYISCSRVSQGAGSVGNSALATAYASNSATSGFKNISYEGNTNKTYSLTQGSRHYMVNYIYEAGYAYANILLDGRYTQYLTFYGYWSPDSDIY